MSSGKPNKIGGKDYKKRKTRRVRAAKKDFSLDVEGGEGYYGTVLKLCGTNRVEVKLNDETTCQVVIPGRMYKKQWIKPGFIVLINNELEIVKIVRENDKNIKEATNLLNKNNMYDESEEEDDEDEETIHLDNSMEKNTHSKSSDNQKVKETQRRNNREKIFTDPELLKKETTNNKSDETSSEEINVNELDIDDI